MINRKQDGLDEMFDRFSDDYMEFDKIKKKRSNRSDLHAFMLLDELMPSEFDIIGMTGHKEFWLSIDLDDFCKVANEEIVLELIRCGIRLDKGRDAFAMFV